MQINDTTVTGNGAREGGGAILDVVDACPGSLAMSDSNPTSNLSGVFQTAPGIYYLLDGKHGTLSLSKTNDT